MLREKGMEYIQRRALVLHDASIGATVVGKKAHFRTKATLNNEEIKPLAIASIKLRLSGGISKGVSQSVKKFC